MPKLSLLIALMITSLLLTAQTQRAESLRPNVVAIAAAGQQGFGFITGSRYDKLFVVTAAHVVEDAAAENSPIELMFYNDYNRYTARIIRNYYPEQDIALLEVPTPEYFSWSGACLGQASIGADVGFIGRSGGWYIPRGHGLGTINSFVQHQIVVDITSVTVGTSGAPLITESGIVGMIINADDVEVRAITVDQLRTILAAEYDYFFTLTTTVTRDLLSTDEVLDLIDGIELDDTTPRGSPTEKRSVQRNSKEIKDRQGHTYSTKVMKNNKRWMTQNLNLQVDNSWCYEEELANCAKYGRLYTWEAAKQACAELGDGWRLPTDEEWADMVDQYGGAQYGHANDDGKAAYATLFGTGSSGFAAQLGGWRHPDGSFDYAGTYSDYWSSSPFGSSLAWYYYFDQRFGQLYRGSDGRDVGFSVRCLQD